MEEQRFSALKTGLIVVGADEQLVGSIREVFRDIGSVESFGAAGIPPQQEGHDPVHYVYSEAMPGAGDAYIAVSREDGDVLYIPFSAISSADAERAILAVQTDDIPAMEWTVRPDALASLADDYPTDTGAEPKVA